MKWDEKKRKENIRRHGFDFRDVPRVFENESVTDVDDRFDYAETRYYTLGILDHLVVVISHTEDDNCIRVISFRKAEKHEEEIYYTHIRN
ncbi:MAG: BrnT family toxin [Pyrinomonadaceae bacterium]